MSAAEDSDRLGIGGNQPPLEAELLERNGPILDRLEQLSGAFARVPGTLDDDETCGKAQDLFAMMRTARQAADSARKLEGQPFAQAKGTVDRFFSDPADALGKLQAQLQARITAYLEGKAAAEKRQRDARAKIEREKAAAEEAEVLAAKERLAEANAAREAAEAKGNTRGAAAAARKEDRAIEDIAKADDNAAAALGRADVIEESTRSTAALSRTRGTLGSVGSLTKRWVVKSVDSRKVDLEELRPHLPADAVRGAAYRWLQAHKNDAGGPALTGCVFEQTSDARIR